MSSSTISWSRNSSGLGTPVDHRHLHPQGGEHRSVLDADDPGPDHGDAARQLLQVEEAVRSHDGLVVRLDAGGIAGAGAHGDQHLVRRQLAAPLGALHLQGVPVDERGSAAHDLDVVAPQVFLDDEELALDDALHVVDQLLHAGPGTGPELLGRLQARTGIGALDSLAEGLGRDGSRLDTDAADHLLLFDDSHLPAQLGSLDGGALAGGSAADADEVIGVAVRAHDFPPEVGSSGAPGECRAGEYSIFAKELTIP